MAKDEAKWAYWGKHIKAWRASGLSRHAYCKREGLKPTTFDYWRPLMARGQLLVSDHAEVKAVKPAVSGNDITLVPVAVMAQGHPVDPPRGDAPFETMTLGQPLKLKSPSGWEMNLPTSIEPNWLIAVLRQLP